MTNTYLILTKAIWEGKLPAKLKTADRLSWNEYTYKDVEKTGKRMVDKYDYYPSEKLNSEPHSVPQVEEEYKYTEQEVDTTTLQNPTWKESAFKLGKLGSPRWNNDSTKVLVKYELAIADGTLDAVKGTSGITALSHSEAIEEIKKDEWSSE